MEGPLNGIRVLDLTRVVAGPFATMILADLGAEVLKLELPGHGDEGRHIPPHKEGESHYFLSLNHNKKSLALDLKKPEGRAVALDLARSCDVVIENFRPGVTKRLGLDYESLRKEKPDLVYCSISAFGQTGPLASRSAFDVAMQAMGGLMSVTGEPGRAPVRMGLPMADLCTGLFAAVGTLAAVVDRQRTGHGQLVDVAMFDAMIGLLTQYAGRYFMTGEDTEPVGSGHPALAPYGAYATTDGYVVIAMLGEQFWPKLCRALGRPEWTDDERFAHNSDRLRRREELDGLIADVMRTKTSAEWERLFLEHDVPHAPVLKTSQVLTHPQARARGMVTEVEHPKLGEIQITGRPIHLPAYENARFTAAPLLGQHTEEVLRSLLGYDEAKLSELRASGAI